MGSAVSKRLREPFISSDVASYRNWQYWLRLQPLVDKIKNLISYKSNEPGPATDQPPCSNEPLAPNDEDAQAGIAKNALGEAIPEGAIVPEQAEILQAQQQHIREEPMQGVQNMLALDKKFNPARSNENQSEVVKPATDAAHEDQEEHVSMYITSSLKVALPRKARLRRLSYEPPSFITDFVPGVPNDHAPGSSIGNPGGQDSPPPPSGSELKIFQTWEKRLYANLPRLNQQSIRIVEILPGTTEKIFVNLIQKTFVELNYEFEALSYVWGAPKPEKKITVNDINVPIGPNLFDALRSLRLPDSKRAIWIDALCINQTSLRERSIEVRKMGEIYRQAKTVMVFLGAPLLPRSSIDELFTFLKRRDDGVPEREETGSSVVFDKECEKCGVDKYVVCKGFVELCLRPWWSRVWIMQEFYLATEEPVWHWGNSHVSNVALKRDMPLLMASSLDLWNRSTIEDASNVNFRTEVQHLIKSPISHFKHSVERINQMISRRAKTNGFDIPSRLYCEISAEASNPRDFVYGLREIFDPRFRQVFVPDYFMSAELLFACLAVFLFQFEAWSDVLWWYPHRFDGTGPDKLPSWLPDFTRRIKPVESELLPRDHMKSRRSEPKLVVLNHVLHAEGYKLDDLVAHKHIHKTDGIKVLRDIWEFDMVTNSRLGIDDDVRVEAQQEQPLLSEFLKVCDSAAEECKLLDEEFRRSHANPPKGPVLRWSSRPDSDESLPTSMYQALPCFDILWYYAYKAGDEAVVALQLVADDDPGLLENIFDSPMDRVFQRTLAHEFITACVLDWENLDTILDRLANRSKWSNSRDSRWVTEVEESPNFSDVRLFLIQSGMDLQRQNRAWGRPLCYTGLLYAILLASKSHGAFTDTVTRVRDAGRELHNISEDFWTRAYVEELTTKSATVAARVRNFDAIVAKYQDRILFCTNLGFRGLSSPGVSDCGTSVALPHSSIALLDGLSFPVMLADTDDGSGGYKFVGCAIVNGVNMHGGDISRVQVPGDVDLGGKIVFKLT